MDWRTLTPSDILTDCIYPDNYSLCIICTNNHLIISHLRVKSVLFRLHPPVISSFIQTPVTFDTSDPGLIVKFMRRKALDTRDDDPESSCRNQYLPPGSWHQRVLAQCSRQASQCTRHSRPGAQSSVGAGQLRGEDVTRSALLARIHIKCVSSDSSDIGSILCHPLLVKVTRMWWGVERTKYTKCKGDYYGLMVMMTYDKCWKVSASFLNVNLCIRRDYIIREARLVPATLRCEQSRPFYPQDNA